MIQQSDAFTQPELRSSITSLERWNKGGTSCKAAAHVKRKSIPQTHCKV